MLNFGEISISVVIIAIVLIIGFGCGVKYYIDYCIKQTNKKNRMLFVNDIDKLYKKYDIYSNMNNGKMQQISQENLYGQMNGNMQNNTWDNNVEKREMENEYEGELTELSNKYDEGDSLENIGEN